ncbi:glycosyltransferase family 4 protein [Fusarium langsethiae]|uniref:Glycosyltransferase family 4 protein n=1 Tax=Fusarium langsethiae TaxID=179993 RepID=A0A0M9EUI0_FUSLA|nr:glycosyltransferase family 4 protein [Fusarium langsethiae]
MVNPYPVKGSSIFFNLAKALPQYEFLAFIGRSINEQITVQKEDISNITLVHKNRSPCVNQEDLWRGIRVLVVPSLWREAWGMVAVEAHIRGIPVVSSNICALPEAILGLNYIMLVSGISGDDDDSGNYIIPEQGMKPWANVITRLIEDRSEYEKTSLHARNNTKRWLETRDTTEIESWMMGLSTNTNATASAHI